jgi:hypothetical protein
MRAINVDLPALGKPFQLQPEMTLFAVLARLVLAWGAVGRRREVGVAKAAASTFRHEDALSNLGEVGEDCC